jgi:hypothetical protein
MCAGGYALVERIAINDQNEFLVPATKWGEYEAVVVTL